MIDRTRALLHGALAGLQVNAHAIAMLLTILDLQFLRTCLLLMAVWAGAGR